MIYVLDLYRHNPRSGGVIQFAENLCSVDSRISSAYEVLKKNWFFSLLVNSRLFGNRFFLDSLFIRFLPSDCDGFIFANYFSPFWLPSGVGRKSIAVVHDLQFKYFPQYFGFWKKIWLDWSLRRSLKICSKIVCISESTRQDFIKYYGESEKLVVIYNPVCVYPSSGASDNFSIRESDYFLANFHFYPHKNIERLISLWLEIVRSGFKVELIFTGGGKQFVDNLISSVVDGDFKKYFLHLGYVPAAELSFIRSHSRGFISLSKFEGFNMSAAESALSGVPLILSDIPVHKEIFSECANFVSVDASFDELRGAVVSVFRTNHVDWSYGKNVSCEYVVSMYRDLFKS